MTFDYFTEAELRALPDLDDADSPHYDTDRLQAAHDWIAGIVERECDTSFVVRTITAERTTGSDLTYLRLRDPYARAVTAITVDGLVYDAGQIAALYLEDGYLYAASTTVWPCTNRGNITVTYTAGYATEPPADLKEAMMKGARNWVLTSAAWSGKDSRATAINNEFGNIQLSTASLDRPTGLPDVDATIMAWARRVRVPKVR